jgi:serine/threonine-protein kinase
MARFVGKGRYVVGEEIGNGGMGVVYAAEDLARTERVAIKVAHGDLSGDGFVLEHMARELRAGLATHHPNVVSVLDGGLEDGRPFVVMELAAGRKLTGLLSQGRLSVHRVITIIDQILAGLAAIHHAGYLHGDLKTDNVLVVGADGEDRVKIIDLGLACEQGGGMAAIDDARMISGTPDYLAPEVVLGGAKTIASDVYAVGVILYELLTGTPPFASSSVHEILRKQVDDEVIPPSLRSPELSLAIALERVVLRSLRKAPCERFPSATAFRSALTAAMRDTRDIPIANRSFSTTAPTMEWIHPDHPLPRAHGTSPPPVRDPHVVVDAALDTTRALVAEHHLPEARAELEAALRMIEGDASADRLAWRLLLSLAGICDALHDPRRARQLARLALACASRNGCEDGRRRAKALIARFAGRLTYSIPIAARHVLS